MTKLTYRFAALTDVGRRRTNNEDSGYASSRVLAVADGMGGAAAGELASATVMNTIRSLDGQSRYIAASADESVLQSTESVGTQQSESAPAAQTEPGTELGIEPEQSGHVQSAPSPATNSGANDALATLERAIVSANSQLSEIIQADPAVEGMGTTIEAMLWDGEKLAVAHLGDSRTYRLRNNSLTQISLDHTFVQSLVDEGRISATEARTHPHRSLLLRALLGRDDNEADYSWIQPQLGDRYLLCSDGLTDMVLDDQIERALRAETIDMAAVDLVNLALEAGGVDNVTVVIAEFVEAGESVDPDSAAADGQPLLVGAVAEQPRPPKARAFTGSISSPEHLDTELDEEQLRYASVAPSRFRHLRTSFGLMALVGLIALGVFAAYQWSQDQFYVGSDGDRVVVYRGVQLQVPGVQLSRVDRVTEVTVESLPEYTRNQVDSGIAAESRAEANQIVEDLGSQATEPQPTPTPAPKKSKRADNTAIERLRS